MRMQSRLIRKDNPFPTTCGFICEHPCEARCRRNMVDDSVNIRGLKRVAADFAGEVRARRSVQRAQVRRSQYSVEDREV